MNMTIMYVLAQLAILPILEPLKLKIKAKAKRNNATFSVRTVTRKALSRPNVGQKEEAKKANLKEIGGKAIIVMKTAPRMPVLVMPK
jgi:hypothetical protein